MLAIEIIDITRNTAKVLQNRNELNGAIIAMSKTSGQAMAAQLAGEIDGYDPAVGAEPEEIAGIKVVYREEVEEPVLITADGKVYSLMPEWARASKQTHREISRIMQLGR